MRQKLEALLQLYNSANKALTTRLDWTYVAKAHSLSSNGLFHTQADDNVYTLHLHLRTKLFSIYEYILVNSKIELIEHDIICFREERKHEQMVIGQPKI